MITHRFKNDYLLVPCLKKARDQMHFEIFFKGI